MNEARGATQIPGYHRALKVFRLRSDLELRLRRLALSLGRALCGPKGRGLPVSVVAVQ